MYRTKQGVGVEGWWCLKHKEYKKYKNKGYGNKLRQMKKHKIKEESYLNYTTIMEYIFSLFFFR